MLAKDQDRKHLYRIFLAAILFFFILSGELPSWAKQRREQDSGRKQDSGNKKRNQGESEPKVSKAPAKFILPVFFLTDRNDEAFPQNYGSKRKYIVNCKHQMNYGTASVLVDNEEKKQYTEAMKRLGWLETAEPGKPSSPENEKLKAFKKNISVVCEKIEKEGEPAKSEFFQRISALLRSAESNSLCLFLHGAEEGFNDAALDAAALSYAMECPVVLYSWPSDPKARGYIVDGGNNEWSQAHFDLFLKDLSDFKNAGPLQITAVAHSMGNRLLVRAAHLIQETRLFKDVELVSPDIDAETFKHYILGMQNKGAIIRLYTSSKDKMLPLSQLIYGGYYRLGEGIGEAFGLNKQATSTPESSEGPMSSGRLLPAQKQGLVERIDFTEADSGFRGHSIPFQILANMVKSDQPGKGYTLAPACNTRGSRFARFVSWTDHLGKISDESDKDLCKRLVRISQDDKEGKAHKKSKKTRTTGLEKKQK